MGSAMSGLPRQGDAQPSLVDQCLTSEDWESLLEENRVQSSSSQLMVVHFSAPWCGPSKMLDPFIQTLASIHKQLKFIKIDVDELQDVAKEYKVKAVPTVVLLKGGNEVERVDGARKAELKKKIEEKSESKS